MRFAKDRIKKDMPCLKANHLLFNPFYKILKQTHCEFHKKYIIISQQLPESSDKCFCFIFIPISYSFPKVPFIRLRFISLLLPHFDTL